MCKLIKRLLFFTLSLLFCLSVSVGVCSAADPETVTMSTSDYQALRSNFLTLQQNNEKHQQLLNQLKEQVDESLKLQNLSNQDWLTLKQQLTEAQQKATLLQKQVTTLEEQLTLARKSSTTAEQGLTSANQSLSELRQAIKSERKAAERRERALKLLTVGALICAATK